MEENRSQGDMATRIAEQELVSTRTINAPREMVFKAWTEPEHLKRWWGPRGFTAPHVTIDPRPGGVYHYVMRSPDGQEFWGKGVFREIVRPERIVYMDSFSDEAGNLVEPTHYGMSPDFPAQTLITVTFAEHQGKTEVTLRYSVGSASAIDRENMQQGWAESLDRLAEYLEKPEHRAWGEETTFSAEPGRHDVVGKRILNAPREHVFEALTDRKLISRWWGPASHKTVVDKMDVKPGGMWRYFQRDPSGVEYAFFGVYHAVVPPERLISTFEFEEQPGHVMLESITLEELPDGRTQVTDSVVFQTVEDRDAAVQSGMESGARESWDRFAQVLETERARIKS